MQLIRIDLKLQRDLCAVLTTFRKYPAILMYLGIQLTPKDPEYQFYSKKMNQLKKLDVFEFNNLVFEVGVLLFEA